MQLPYLTICNEKYTKRNKKKDTYVNNIMTISDIVRRFGRVSLAPDQIVPLLLLAYIMISNIYKRKIRLILTLNCLLR